MTAAGRDRPGLGTVPTVPPGWPAGRVPPPGSPGWEARAVGWLLDHVPPEFRAHDVLRHHPAVLAWLAGHHAEATVAGLRTAYSAARRELQGVAGPEVVTETLQALEAEGARAVALRREVHLVAQALQGHRAVPRL